MSHFDIGLLPSGHLHGFLSITDGAADNKRHDLAIEQAFSRSVGEGLFSLAAKKSDASLTPSLHYWRNFACQYMSERCLLTPTESQQADPSDPFTDAETMPAIRCAAHAGG